MRRPVLEKKTPMPLGTSSFLVCLFSRDLQYIFSDVRRRVADRGETIWKRIVAATVFLRFFCPAILSPSLFHVTHSKYGV